MQSFTALCGKVVLEVDISHEIVTFDLWVLLLT